MRPPNGTDARAQSPPLATGSPSRAQIAERLSASRNGGSGARAPSRCRLSPPAPTAVCATRPRPAAPALPPPSCCLRAAAAACSPMRRSPPRPRPRRAPREEAPSTSLPPGSCRRRAAPWRRRWSPREQRRAAPAAHGAPPAARPGSRRSAACSLPPHTPDPAASCAPQTASRSPLCRRRLGAPARRRCLARPNPTRPRGSAIDTAPPRAGGCPARRSRRRISRTSQPAALSVSKPQRS
mmetsp:Transcript_25113/g.82371  ORF Transcript_25113/g.82371 Transcript_25113/m.82371 type:complete len:239 (-) Transcript_25113:444-1160(-)